MTGTPILSAAPQAGSRPLRPFGVLIAAAFAYRAALIHLFPTVYSWDAFTRLLDPTRLLVRHWMPIPQLPIFLVDLAGGDMIAVRLVYAAIGTAGVALVGWVSLKSQGPTAGFVTLVLAATLPGFVIYTLVPYQEGALVLFLFAFLCVWKLDPSEMTRFAQVVAATSLALACLSRYEAWVFAGIFALRPIMERRGRELWIFAPAVLAIGGWLMIFPMLDATNPMANPAAADSAKAALPPLVVLAEAIWLSIVGFHYVGLPLAIVGAVFAFRRGGILGREVILFWIAVGALNVFRAMYTGLATERMTVLPLMVATLYVPMGLAALFERFTVDARRRLVMSGVIVSALVGWFGLTTKGALEHRARRYAHERSAALHLEELVTNARPGERIGIVPRPIRNTWGESTLKSIFGQSMKLRPDDPKWVLGSGRVQEEGASLDRILFFDPQTSRYQTRVLNQAFDAAAPTDPLASAGPR